MSRSKKVFIGLINTAGISIRLKSGFDQINIKADFYDFGDDTFKYPSGKKVIYSDFRIVRIFQKKLFILKLIFSYSYFIYLSPFTLLPNFRDIKLLRFFNKKSMLIFTGCDVRIPEKVSNFKWNPCAFCTSEYQKFVGCVIETKKIMIPTVENIFDIIVCPEEAAGYLKSGYTKAYFPISLDDYKIDKNKAATNPIKILHAPSSPIIKGTKYINEVINKLKEKYDFEYSLLTKVPVSEVKRKIVESDLIIDQLLVGNYGLFSIEAMALSKPVVCYIRDEIWNEIQTDCPIFNANADTLYGVLENIILNPNILTEKSIESRNYIEKYHDAKKIARQYYNLFEELRN